MNSLDDYHAEQARKSAAALKALPEGHIVEGNLIWYGGLTSGFSWNCPAEICWVNPKRTKFRVRSLDDMRQQTQPYDFSPFEDTTESRLSMRAIRKDEALEYLAAQRAEAVGRIESSRKSIDDAKASHEAAKKAVPAFDAHMKRLGIVLPDPAEAEAATATA